MFTPIRAALLFAGLSAAMPLAPARAALVTMSYTGSTASRSGASATGSGIFATSDDNSPAGKADLSSFDFLLKVIDHGMTTTYDYGLANLTSFRAVFSGGALTALSFAADMQPSSHTGKQSFDVASLGVNDAASGDCAIGTIGQLVVSQAPVVSKVPEPASLALLAGGLLAFGVIRRRRRVT